MGEFVLHIENGQVANKKHMRDAFFGLKDGQYMVTIKWWKRRSLGQNAYYHAVVCGLILEGLKDAGYDDIESTEEVHEVLKRRFLKKAVYHRDTGEVLEEITKSTTKLTTVEFEEYLEKCRRFASEYLGMYIPLPNEARSYFNR